jgi:2-phosphoglycerate kinase
MSILEAGDEDQRQMTKTGFSSCIECNSARSGRLIVIRGNSGSGKSAVAAEIRRRYGRGLALVGQDNLRRHVLREHDVAGGANIDLIDLTA